MNGLNNIRLSDPNTLSSLDPFRIFSFGLSELCFLDFRPLHQHERTRAPTHNPFPIHCRAKASQAHPPLDGTASPGGRGGASSLRLPKKLLTAVRTHRHRLCRVSDYVAHCMLHFTRCMRCAESAIPAGLRSRPHVATTTAAIVTVRTDLTGEDDA
jgi:hypothetical protein